MESKMPRLKVSSGAKWEPIVGYSRAVRVGSHIYISGTTSFGENGKIVGVNDPYAQTIQILKNIDAALKKAGAKIKDIVQTRIYVINIDHWQEIGRAHGEYFKEILPATSMVEVRRLIEPDVLVEIEALAIIES